MYKGLCGCVEKLDKRNDGDPGMVISATGDFSPDGNPLNYSDNYLKKNPNWPKQCTLCKKGFTNDKKKALEDKNNWFLITANKSAYLCACAKRNSADSPNCMMAFCPEVCFGRVTPSGQYKRCRNK